MLSERAMAHDLLATYVPQPSNDDPNALPAASTSRYGTRGSAGNRPSIVTNAMPATVWRCATLAAFWIIFSTQRPTSLPTRRDIIGGCSPTIVPQKIPVSASAAQAANCSNAVIRRHSSKDLTMLSSSRALFPAWLQRSDILRRMDTDVIVVGAGAAGLAAASWLAERSARVIVLEGRDRIGGRVMWKSVGSVDVPADLGAEFIHGAAPETSALLNEAGLTKVETGGESWVCGPTDALRMAEDDFGGGDIFERVRPLAEDESVDAFLRRFEHDPRLSAQAKQARAFVEGFEAADPALASARSIAYEIRSGIDSTSSRPVGGYAPLFGQLAERCARSGVDLRLDTPVERIRWAPGAVTLEASAHGRASTLRARCAIVTVPVGVLREGDDALGLAFVPALPAKKVMALRGIEMGHAVRVVLAFRTPFWEQLDNGLYRNAAFFRCEGTAFNAFWTQAPLRSRTIVAWAGGPRATAMDGMPGEERIDRARDAFGALFGQRGLARRECEGGVTHDWSADPFARGVYSYVGTGAAAARAVLGAPVAETLFFAGEATSLDGQGGTVSGAFETGMRAASEVARALEIPGAPSRIVV